MSDQTLQSALATTIAALLAAYVLVLVVRRLGRVHAGLMVGLPLVVGFVARVATIAAVDGTGLTSTLRGGDETTFMENATGLAALPWTSAHWLSTAGNEFHIAVFAAELKLGSFTPTALRLMQVTVALVGILLIVAAVHELGGRRASRVAAWVLMLEPAGVFFDSALHKEPFIKLAAGLAVYGGTRLWRRLELRGIAFAGAGCLIALGTREYAGWFLVAGCTLLALHGGLRRLDRPLRAMPLIYAVVLAAFLTAPTLLQASSPEKLQRLQISQDYTTAPGAQADSALAAEESNRANSNNLAFEHVDFSTRERIFTNLPRRIRDVVLRPYPWQVQNTSQAMGALGSSVALAGLLLLLGYAWRARGRILPLTAPFLYPMTFLLVASALAAGNAGTSFRYRTHVVTLALAMLIVLRTSVLVEERTRRAPPRASAAHPTGGIPQPAS